MKKKDNKSTYAKEFWDERYSDNKYVYGEKPNDFLAENLKYFKEGGKILCLAEGEARNAVFLATKGFEVTAVDQSSVAKEKALKLSQKNDVHINYEVADLRNFDFGENVWDGIISISAHTPSDVREHVHSSVKKALKEKGIFLLEGYNLKQLQYKTGGPKKEDMLFSRENLESDFAGFEILLSQDFLRHINEGEFHNGDSSVTQFITRKEFNKKQS